MTLATKPIMCHGYFDQGRPCQRPKDHEGECGTLHSTYITFATFRRVEEYVGQSGYEQGDLALPLQAYDAIAASKMSGKPTECVVIGRQDREDGAWFLILGASTAHIKATTDWLRQDNGHLRLRCPACQSWDGKHLKACERYRG